MSLRTYTSEMTTIQTNVTKEFRAVFNQEAMKRGTSAAGLMRHYIQRGLEEDFQKAAEPQVVITDEVSQARDRRSHAFANRLTA